MKKIIKYSLVILSISLMTGCDMDIFNNKELAALREQNKKLQLQKLKLEANRSVVVDEKRLLYQNRENLAKIEMQKTLAEIDQVKEIERLHLQNSLERERLEIKKRNDEAQLSLNAKIDEAKNRLYLKLSLIAMGALLLIIVAFFIYYYLKKRREDKLIAYRDNLDKYFRAKENEARVKIAEKILDTVASGKLSSAHEARLIEVFNAENKEDFQSDNLLEDAIIVDDTK